MVRSLAFLVGAAVPLATSATCPGGVCATREVDADTALLQTRRVGVAGGPAKKYEERTRLVIELDLERMTKHRGLRAPRATSGKASPSDCDAESKRFFDDATKEFGLAKELRGEELSSFRQRFVNAMQQYCKHDGQNWFDSASKEMQRQKPVMTAALASAMNEAGLGFQTKMKEWLLHETMATFEGRLGFLPTKEGEPSVIQRQPSRTSVQLPERFRAEEQWPACQEAILRIHNQGHCGSCWAFGGLASVDARMCVASNGAWDAPAEILSRLHVVSCAPGTYYPGSDGCQGGWPHWAMEMMGNVGVVSKSCVPYYITGEGTEHFQQQDTAPPCVEHCQGGYSLSMAQDLFSMAGVEQYDWLRDVHGDADKIQMTKEAIYTEGPVSYAFMANSAFMGYSSGVFSTCTGNERANHAVYAFGWGVLNGMEFLESSNSWGPDWGDNGHFKIAPLCVTDVIIPGTMQGVIVNHAVGNVTSGVPADPDNENWPWKQVDQCPFVDGCVTDLGGAGDYGNNEECVSSKLNGRQIHVVEFETESHYDVLKINGHAFSGKEGNGLDLSSLEGLVVGNDGLHFTSDFSVPGPGFKLCDATPECPFVDGCVTDMEGAADYTNKEACVSNRLNGKSIRVVEFATERGYDILTVNGKEFSGTAGNGFDPAALSDLVVDDNGISFKSDFSVPAPGFKICEA